jgi:Methyltransferase domain
VLTAAGGTIAPLMTVPGNRLRPLTDRLPPGLRQRVSAWLGRKGLEVASHYSGREFVALDYPGQGIARLDYPTSARNAPRWDPHPGLARIISEREDVYIASIEVLRGYRDDFLNIAVRARDPREPGWLNGWQPGLDTGALYGFLRSRRPSLYLEIGSGASTKFARRAIEDGGLPTRIVSIDPHPRAEIDEICDTVLRAPLEDTDLSAFDDLSAGDVVFFDGSHRIFMNSDATVFFLEVLLRLPAGVLVGTHDIYLPYDYPLGIAERYYSEQYLLAAYLLAGWPNFDTVLPAWYVTQTPHYRPPLESLWEHPALAEVERYGCAYWLETR